MKKPLISVLMPTLNSQRFIREALNSIVDQTYPSLELVVVDGGSTDSTLSILREYDDGKNMIIVESSLGRGMGYDLNLGLAACNGAFIARMDADDIAYPWRLDAQYQFMSRHEEIELLGTGAELFWNQTGEQKSPPWHDHIRDMYFVNNPFFHPTIMFRRKVYDDGRFRYNESFKADEDYELWGRLIPNTITANLDACSIRYRLHDTNGQREPWKQRFKTVALENFAKAEGVDNPDLISALSEFQCSNFVTPEMYLVMSDYARQSLGQDHLPTAQRKPKLGWLHWALTHFTDYSNFMSWYCQTKGWAV